jgi:hypothetical protein
MAKQKPKRANGNKNKDNCDCKDMMCCGGMRCKCGCGGFYFLGALGSAIYFISNTSGFWNVVLAILKAIVWPVFISMKILGL